MAAHAPSHPPENTRRFIRHTADVPLEVRSVAAPARRTSGRDVSHGGLSFLLEDDLAIGSTLDLRMPDVDPPFEARARVVWSRREADGYCIGVAFLDADDAFRARMVEQVSAIERYRREVREREGRDLDPEAAAREWIGRYAGSFPSGG